MKRTQAGQRGLDGIRFGDGEQFVLVGEEEVDPGQTLADARDPNGNGIALTTTDRGTVQLSLRGAFGPATRSAYTLGVLDFGIGETSWDCDPGRLKLGVWHHIAVIVDGGPKTIAFVVDGELHDGGGRRQFGWARFPRELRTVNFGDTLRLAPRLKGDLQDFRIYDRALRTTEAIGSWRAGMGRASAPSR